MQGKLALVTGAASGIGAATAERLAAEGAQVVLVDVDSRRLVEVADRIRQAGGVPHVCAFDVSQATGWQRAAGLLHGLGRTLDILVNNAYVLDVRPLHELSLESWNRQIGVDLTAVYLAIHTFAGQLITNRGCIVNVSSVHAVTALPGHPAYSAAKGGMLALTRQLAVEYGGSIRVNAVLPGPILTAVWDAVPETGRHDAAAQTALGRMGEASEVAAVITFLASDEASFVTGASLPVDGGLTIKFRG